MIALCILAAIGAFLASRHHQPYLAARLFALVGAAIPAAAFAERFVAVFEGMSRSAQVMTALVAAFVICLLVIVAFPAQFFHFLAQLRAPPK